MPKKKNNEKRKKSITELARELRKNSTERDQYYLQYPLPSCRTLIRHLEELIDYAKRNSR